MSVLCVKLGKGQHCYYSAFLWTFAKRQRCKSKLLLLVETLMNQFRGKHFSLVQQDTTLTIITAVDHNQEPISRSPEKVDSVPSTVAKSQPFSRVGLSPE